MDKFSELIAKGVAAFNYTPIASDTPEQCPVCKEYNNVFGASTDTHMSHIEDGRMVITGSIIKNHMKFDKFIWATQFMGVDYSHAFGHAITLAEWMCHHNLKGNYGKLNGDDVYFLTASDKECGPDSCKEPVEMKQMMCVTDESNIPQSSRILSRHRDLTDVQECLGKDIDETASNMNASKDIYGSNWVPVNLSDGRHIVGNINNIVYKI